MRKIDHPLTGFMMGADENIQIKNERDNQTLTESKVSAKEELHHVKGSIVKFAKAMKKIDDEPVSE